ncbi:hypothetical protein C0J52_04305 [Blattella germanica]|nr:hypothetical protein C0J52_04305 [Blattella germanica]
MTTGSVKGHWLGRRVPHEWPARSPDLTLCDFLWAWAKDEVYWTKPCTLDELEARIRKVLAKIPHNFLQKNVDSIPGHLSSLVNAISTYIEF